MWFKLETILRHIYDDLHKQRFRVVVFEKIKLILSAFVNHS